MPVSPGASGMQPRDPCRPWRGTLASGHKPRGGLLALPSLESNPQLSFATRMEDWTCLGQHKRQPEFPVVTRESRRNSRKTTTGEALSSQLQFARSEAVKQNKEVAVNITTAAPWGLEVDGVKLLSGNDYPGTALTASDATIVFEGVRGMIKLGGKEAANDTSATMTITLDSYQIEAHVGVMGRVLLCSPEGKSVGGYGKC